MARVKRGTKARQRRKRKMDRAEGFFGRRKNCFRVAAPAVDHALEYAYTGRKQRKRDFRRLWIQRINAAARSCGVSYNKLMDLLKKGNLEIDRRVLADIATRDPKVFEQIVASVKTAG